VTLLCCTPAVWIPALILAATIAFSRIYLRVHYVSDVIGGLILGLIDGTAATLILQRVFMNVAFY
jgi:undecaprenyl-diphosphatase